MIISDETIVDNNLKVNGKMIVDFDKLINDKKYSLKAEVIDIVSDNVENIIIKLFHHHIVVDATLMGMSATFCFDFTSQNPNPIDSVDGFDIGNIYTASGGATLGSVVSKWLWVYQVQISDEDTLTVDFLAGNNYTMEADITPTSITDYVNEIIITATLE